MNITSIDGFSADQPMTDAEALTEAQLEAIEMLARYKMQVGENHLHLPTDTALALVSMSRAALAAQGEAAPVAWVERAEFERLTTNNVSGLYRLVPGSFLNQYEGSPDKTHVGIYTRPTPPADAAGAIPKAIEALKPFAEAAELYDEIPGVLLIHGDMELWQQSTRVRLSKLCVNDLREARATIAMLTAAPSPPSAESP